MEWTTLHTMYDEFEAEIIKGLLEDNGIEAVIRSSRTSPYPVNFGKMGEVALLVRQEDLEKAQQLISS